MGRGKQHPQTGLYASLEEPKSLEAELTEK